MLSMNEMMWQHPDAFIAILQMKHNRLPYNEMLFGECTESAFKCTIYTDRRGFDRFFSRAREVVKQAGYGVLEDESNALGAGWEMPFTFFAWRTVGNMRVNELQLA